MIAMQSIKRSLIEKSNTTIVVVTSTACFIFVFCVVASLSLFDQLGYQNRVINAEKSGLKQLVSDVQSSKRLESSYSAFTSTSTNIIGGNPTGTGPQDGNNTKIVLDALPSNYDYPALATSLETILTNQSVQIESISGTDENATQSSNQSNSNPTPQAMPFQVVVVGDYAAIQRVVTAFEASIRPFQIETFELAGNQSQLTMTIGAQTYWQPAKNLNVRTEVVR